MFSPCLRIRVRYLLARGGLINLINGRSRIDFIVQKHIFFRVVSPVQHLLVICCSKRCNGLCHARIAVFEIILRVIKRRFINRLAVNAGISAKEFVRRSVTPPSSLASAYHMFHDVGVVVGRSEEIEYSEGNVSVNTPDELAGPCLGELFSVSGIQFINIQVHQRFCCAFDDRIVVVPQRHTSLVAKSYALGEPFYIAAAERKQRGCIVKAFITILQHFGLGRTGCRLHFFD